MEQENLPIRYKIPIKKILIWGAAGLLIALVALFLYFWNSTSDRLLSYFPEDTALYVSVKAEPKLLESQWFAGIPLDQELRLQISNLVAEDLNTRASRNIAVGLVPISNGLSPVVILNLRKDLDAGHPLFGILQNRGYHAYRINNIFTNSFLLVISKDEEAFARISDVINEKTGTIAHLYPVLFEARRIPSQKGVFVARLQALSAIIPAEMSKYIQPYIENEKLDIVAGGISISGEGLSISSSGYAGNRQFQLARPDDVRYGLMVHQPVEHLDAFFQDSEMQAILKGLEEGYSFNYQKDVKDKGLENLSYLSYPDADLFNFTLPAGNVLAFDEIVKKFIIEYLAVKNQKIEEVTLPDWTTIKERVKDRSDLAFETNDKDQSEVLTDPKSKSVFVLARVDNSISVTMEKKPTQFPAAQDFLKGCSIRDDSESVVLGSELIKEIGGGFLPFKSLVISTYPQGYPQFLACAR